MRRYYYLEPFVLGVMGIVCGIVVLTTVHAALGLIVIGIGALTIWMGSEKDWDDRP